MIIFASAPAGLGHLRVTQALYHGLPGARNALILGAQDHSISYLHRLTSIHPLSRAIMEWGQQGVPEDLFTWSYRRYLRATTKLLYEQLTTILDERLEAAQTVLVVATHFGLAHQLSALKDQLQQERNVRIILVVCVTDDSPQHIWYVPGADLIVTPSESTRQALVTYGKAMGLAPVEFAVIPYPVSTQLNKPLTEGEFSCRKRQLDAQKTEPITVMIPVSGAAVGLDFFLRLLDELFTRSNRFHFQVVVKTSVYTQPFISKLHKRSYVTIHTTGSDREIVDLYDTVYRQNVIGLEVTKPSEQAFKALMRPNHRGGSILLFSQPVGRQEYDNLAFLSRHQLIPESGTQEKLWDLAQKKQNVTSEIKTLAKFWRGIKLPSQPERAAEYIWWSLEQEIFRNMLTCPIFPRASDPHAHELTPDGVSKFWQRVAQLVSGF